MNFWDNLFKDGAIWDMNPTDSAIWCAQYFKDENISNVLIPGIGYGRNAVPFLDKEIHVTGIEISQNAIETANNEGLTIPIHHGSVLEMPLDNNVYNGIYCYSVLHLLNKHERKQFLTSCYNQLNDNGIMVFVVVSTDSSLFKQGRLISNNRRKLVIGQTVYFYNKHSIEKEFGNYGLIGYTEYDEPIKHMPNEDPLRCFKIVCRKY